MPKLPALFLVSIACLVLASCAGESAPSAAKSKGASESTADFETVQTPAASPKTSSDDSPRNKDAEAERSLADNKAKAKGDKTGIEIVPKSDAEKPLPKRDSIVGRWEFRLSNFIEDVVGLLIEIEKTDEGYTAIVLNDSPMMPEWKIKSSELTADAAMIEFTNHQDLAVDFHGTLQSDGIVRGNVVFGEDGLDLAYWMPTRLESLEGADQKVPAQEIKKLEGFQPTPEDALITLREKAKELVPSTLGYHFYRSLAGRIRIDQPDADYFSDFPADYIAAATPWGEQVVTEASIDLAYTSAVAGYDSKVTQPLLAKAQERLGDTASPSQSMRLNIAEGMTRLSSDEADSQETGVAQLTEILNDDPFNATIANGLAAYYERSGQLEEALTRYAALAALPSGAGDMGPVMRLWKELDRDPKQVDAFLNETYANVIYNFADESSDAPRAQGQQKTVLGELFTGGSCPPCVSADVATGGLEKTYPQSDFILLRYHQHIPGADPLTVATGEQRARQYYRIAGTPTLIVNGQPVPPTVTSIYGDISNAPTGYDELRELIDPLLSESSDVGIDLQATLSDNAIHISAAVSGPEELPETWRLRLCVTEDEIVHPARNGVRLHEMVVRTMPGDAEGVAPSEGTLAFNETISLDSIRDSIRAYLVSIPGLSPPPMALKDLHVVAFVQDDADQSIVQAVSVPVTAATQKEPGDKADTTEADAAADSDDSPDTAETAETAEKAETAKTPEATETTDAPDGE